MKMLCIVLGLVTALLSACGSSETPDTVSVSERCLQSMATAEAETRPNASDPLITETLSSCSTVAEWFEALRTHPGAFALTDASFVSDLELETACWRHEDTPVCIDAVDVGRLYERPDGSLSTASPSPSE